MKRLLAAIFLAFLAAPLSAGAASRAYASAAPVGDEQVVEIEAGKTAQVVLTFKNAGTYNWRGTGKTYVSAYATGPYKRKSVFWHSAWPTRYQAARLNQSLVKPGQSGTVTLTLHAPQDLGTYREQFQLAVENTAFIYGSTARLTIKVVPETVTLSTPVGARSVYAMDAATGRELRADNADEVRSIASITKLMTVMVARETGLDPETLVTLERQDEVGGGRLQVPIGTKLTVRNLVAATIVGSANNTANALARATGLTREEFLRRMNEKARSLGLLHTSFADPTGIEVENLSTAREVAGMARVAFEDPWIKGLAAEPEYEIAMVGGTRTIKNTNALLADSRVDVLAGKTGFIYEAGYTLATELAKEGQAPVLVVVLGSETKPASFRDARVVAEQAWLTQASLASL